LISGRYNNIICFGIQYFVPLIIILFKISGTRFLYNFNYIIMRHLSVIILIGLLVVLPSCKHFKGGGLFGRKANKTALLQAKLDSTRVADSIRKAQDDLQALENEKLLSQQKAEEERVAAENKFKYNIIIGSFITPEYAKGLAEVYRQKGYDPKIIKVEGSRFELVSAEAFESLRKAVSRLKEYQATVELDSWIYIKK
jgi:hypothetical protein